MTHIQFFTKIPSHFFFSQFGSNFICHTDLYSHVAAEVLPYILT